MPVAPLTAPVPTTNRYEALSEYISSDVFAKVNTPEGFPIELFLKPIKLSKKRKGKEKVSSSMCSTSRTLQQTPEKIIYISSDKFGRLIDASYKAGWLRTPLVS